MNVTRISIVVAWLLLGVSADCRAAGSTETEDLYEQGKTLFEAGDFLDAISYLEDAKTADPKNNSINDYLVKAYKLVGIKFYTEDQLPEALQFLRKAITIQPNNEEILKYISRVENEIHQFDRSQEPNVETTGLIVESTLMEPSPAQVNADTQVVGSTIEHHADLRELQVIPSSRHRFALRSGLAAGLTVSPSEAEARTGTGWHFVGYFDVARADSPFFLRLSMLYDEVSTKWTRATAVEAQSQSIVAGVGLDGMVHLWRSPSAGVFVGGGVGAYRASRSGYDGQLTDDVLDRTTSGALAVSVGWRRTIGLFGLTTSVRYMGFAAPRCPSVWQFSFGIERL